MNLYIAFYVPLGTAEARRICILEDLDIGITNIHVHNYVRKMKRNNIITLKNDVEVNSSLLTIVVGGFEDNIILSYNLQSGWSDVRSEELIAKIQECNIGLI